MLIIDDVQPSGTQTNKTQTETSEKTEQQPAVSFFQWIKNFFTNLFSW